MCLNKLGLKELLFLFLNIKGCYKSKSKKICKKGSEIPDFFVANTTISNSKKRLWYTSKSFGSVEQDQFVKSLNHYYKFSSDFVPVSTASIKIEFKNNSKISISELLEKIYEEIRVKQLQISTKDFSKDFAIAAFAFRGSFDLNANFYTTDLHPSRVSTKKDIGYLMKLLVFVEFNDRLNLNFRELQGEGTKRATQFRINLKYFSEMYLNELKNVNPYRYDEFIDNQQFLDSKSDENKNGNAGFLERIAFYLDHIVEKKSSLSSSEIKELREKLNLSIKDKDTKKKTKKRSNSAKIFVKLTKPERCASCHNVYPNKDRSFKMRNGYWYFEIHHVISFANKRIQTEDFDNLVKLCPVCHRALTPHRAEKAYQLGIISNILLDDAKVLRYVTSVQKKLGNKQKPEDFVYGHLK